MPSWQSVKGDSNLPRFFCENINETEAVLTGEEARHLVRVLRLGPGDDVTLCDGRGTDYACKILSVGDTVTFSVEGKTQNAAEPNVEITLYQCLPKGDKFEFIIQKAVELGVTRIVPVQSRYCVAKIAPADFQKKRERFQKISVSAAKQSGRGIIPEISHILSYRQAVEELASQQGILCYEGGGASVGSLVDGENRRLAVMIGSEGGFSEEEVALAVEKGVRLATLGPRILRCETAPLVALTLLLYETGNM